MHPRKAAVVLWCGGLCFGLWTVRGASVVLDEVLRPRCGGLDAFNIASEPLRCTKYREGLVVSLSRSLDAGSGVGAGGVREDVKALSGLQYDPSFDTMA